jgi:hypothetical protein
VNDSPVFLVRNALGCAWFQYTLKGRRIAVFTAEMRTALIRGDENLNAINAAVG